MPCRGLAVCVSCLLLPAASQVEASEPAAAPAIALAPPLDLAPPVGIAPAELPPPIADSLRRLPPPDVTWEATFCYGPPTATAGPFPGSPVSGFSATITDAEPEVTLAPSAVPSGLEPVPGDYLTDADSDLIQIAPDPADPWSSDPFGRYSYHGSGLPPGTSSWMPGNGDRMGMLTFAYAGAMRVNEKERNAGLGIAWHLVSGPRRTDMPPQLWDLTVHFGRRRSLDSYWSYDIAMRPGWFSDFQASARNGFRVPAHGVLYYTPSDTFQLLAGIDCLDRDDIPVLPVFGAVLKPHPNIRLDAVFPRPRIAVRGGERQRWVYLGAEMGGGTWAIERADLRSDVVTYRDYRLSLGLQLKGEQADFVEVSYVFGRHLEYRSGTPSYDPLETTVLRFVNCY